MKHTKKALAAALAGLFAMGSAAHANVVVDLFVDPVGGAQQVTTQVIGAANADFNQTGPFAVSQVIGGYRDMWIEKVSDASPPTNLGAATMTAGFGVLSVDNATGVTSRAAVTWDGSNVVGNDPTNVNTAGLGGIDLTAGGAADRFLTDVLSADLGFDYEIQVWDMNGNTSTLAAQVQFAVASPVDADYLFTWFNLASNTYCDGVAPFGFCNPLTQLEFTITRPGAAVDFTNIGAMQLRLSDLTLAAADFSIGSVRTVPEPTGLALLGAGLLAAVARRRKKALVA